jgi:hypothetical protein
MPAAPEFLRRGPAALVLGLLLLPPGPARAAEGSDTITAVSAKTSPDYSRLRRPDGAVQDEYYAFGEGGYYRAPMRDDSIDTLSFLDVARKLAAPLARQHYLPTKNPASARLLIMVYWGTTSGTAEPRSENFRYNRYNNTLLPSKIISSSNVNSLVPEAGGQIVHENSQTLSDAYYPAGIQGDIIDERNAEILGYDSNLTLPAGYQITARRIEHEDLVNDVERNRYFVVLMAYDFQILWKRKERRLLWEARFSIGQQANDFTATLPRMAAYASQYFGEDTRGLIRRPLPQASVEIGEPQVVAAATGADRSPTDTTLIAGASLLNPAPAPSRRDPPAIPAALAGEIAAYQKEKADLQDALAALIRTTAPGDETRQAIDAFNGEHAARISALNRSADTIRSALAVLAAARQQPAGELSVDDLLRQFSDSIRATDFRESLFTHP